jgi:hypothetical protein
MARNAANVVNNGGLYKEENLGSSINARGGHTAGRVKQGVR